MLTDSILYLYNNIYFDWAVHELFLLFSPVRRTLKAGGPLDFIRYVMRNLKWLHLTDLSADLLANLHLTDLPSNLHLTDLPSDLHLTDLLADLPADLHLTDLHLTDLPADL